MNTTVPQRAALTIRRLRKEYPNARTSLSYKTPFQFLVSVILSAQCTDKKVNQVTIPIFIKYKSAKDFAFIPLRRLEKMVHQTGFYKSKALAISTTAIMVRDRFHNRVPHTMKEMLTLRGVARKTANVVLGELYGISEGIAVDTHVTRLVGRLGLSKQNSPEKIERDLMRLVPRQDWLRMTNLLIEHGRAVCTARAPDCVGCTVHDICPAAFSFARRQPR